MVVTGVCALPYRGCGCRESHPVETFRAPACSAGTAGAVLSLLWAVLGAARSLFRTRQELALENLALRQRVAVLIWTAAGDGRDSLCWTGPFGSSSGEMPWRS